MHWNRDRELRIQINPVPFPKPRRLKFFQWSLQARLAISNHKLSLPEKSQSSAADPLERKSKTFPIKNPFSWNKRFVFSKRTSIQYCLDACSNVADSKPRFSSAFLMFACYTFTHHDARIHQFLSRTFRFVLCFFRASAKANTSELCLGNSVHHPCQFTLDSVRIERVRLTTDEQEHALLKTPKTYPNSLNPAWIRLNLETKALFDDTRIDAPLVFGDKVSVKKRCLTNEIPIGISTFQLTSGQESSSKSCGKSKKSSSLKQQFSPEFIRKNT